MAHNKYKKQHKSKADQLQALINQQRYDMGHDNDIDQHRDNATNRRIKSNC